MGERGATGARGIAGIKGIQGPAGVPGTGIMGQKGEKGSAGKTGMFGGSTAFFEPLGFVLCTEIQQNVLLNLIIAQFQGHWPGLM